MKVILLYALLALSFYQASVDALVSPADVITCFAETVQGVPDLQKAFYDAACNGGNCLASGQQCKSVINSINTLSSKLTSASSCATNLGINSPVSLDGSADATTIKQALDNLGLTEETRKIVCGLLGPDGTAACLVGAIGNLAAGALTALGGLACKVQQGDLSATADVLGILGCVGNTQVSLIKTILSTSSPDQISNLITLVQKILPPCTPVSLPAALSAPKLSGLNIKLS